ncbi:MAG: response regulator [Desulfobaccales bacterium]
MMQPYRLLLADDHVIFREMIKKSLNDIPGLEVAGEAGNGLEVLELTQKLNPDMVILDLDMPHTSGLELANKIKSCHPGIKILVLTMHKSKEYLTLALQSGCQGYVLKDNAFKDLVAAIESIREGKPYISNLITQTMVHHLRRDANLTDSSERLTHKEKEVLKYLSTGKSVKDTAESLSISKATVCTHIANIKRKLSIRSSINLMRYALRKGYASLT